MQVLVPVHYCENSTQVVFTVLLSVVSDSIEVEWLREKWGIGSTQSGRPSGILSPKIPLKIPFLRPTTYIQYVVPGRIRTIPGTGTRVRLVGTGRLLKKPWLPQQQDSMIGREKERIINEYLIVSLSYSTS